MESYEKIAKILRTDKDTIKTVEEKIAETLGHNSVLENIAKENENLIKEKMEILEVKEMDAAKIYSALINKIKLADNKIFDLFEKPDFTDFRSLEKLILTAQEAANTPNGFFLKEEKAKKFLLNTPPQNILKFLNYKNAEELVQNENLFEIFAGLRFIEDPVWLNAVFFKQYENLTAADFEKRKINIITLNEKWLKAAEKFLKKKYHNISHLKELGIIFIIPAKLNLAGETIRTFSLILHYLHEIDFYSKLFEKYSKEKGFAEKLVSGLRGDVLDIHFPNEDLGKKWLIIQRYLAKDDEYDWRLFYPHINPEAIHWTKAENDIARVGEKFNIPELIFWNNLDWVGDFFKSESGDALVSFNLIDAAMDLVMERDMIKYLYHHNESLWNKIFISFLGQEETENLITENFDKGFIEI